MSRQKLSKDRHENDSPPPAVQRLTAPEPKAATQPSTPTAPELKAAPASVPATTTSSTAEGQPKAQSKAASRRPQPPPSQDLDDRLTAHLEAPVSFSVIETFDSSSQVPTERMSFHPDGATTTIFSTDITRPQVNQSWIHELTGAFELPPQGKGKSKGDSADTTPRKPTVKATAFPRLGGRHPLRRRQQDPWHPKTPVSQRLAQSRSRGYRQREASIGGRGRWDARNATFRCVMRCPARDIPPGNPGSFMCSGAINTFAAGAKRCARQASSSGCRQITQRTCKVPGRYRQYRLPEVFRQRQEKERTATLLSLGVQELGKGSGESESQPAGEH